MLPFGDNIKAGEKYCIKENVPMSIKKEYLKGVYEGLAQRNPEQKEFLQAVEEEIGRAHV